MIELLLSARVELGDSLLHAIDEENVEAVELLLKAHQQQPGKKDLQVSDVITPVSLGHVVARHLSSICRVNCEIGQPTCSASHT